MELLRCHLNIVANSFETLKMFEIYKVIVNLFSSHVSESFSFVKCSEHHRPQPQPQPIIEQMLLFRSFLLSIPNDILSEIFGIVLEIDFFFVCPFPGYSFSYLYIMYFCSNKKKKTSANIHIHI